MSLAPTPQPAISVSELNHRAKNLLESHFDYVRVEGEIGDFTGASSGHWYFTLKDSDAQVRCAMFRGANAKVKIRPGKGDSVRIRARVSLYENRGEFQLIVQHLEPAGDGALQLAFERLKEKLQAEGLFDPDRKRPLAAGARRVGVVTSAKGAAIHDIVSVLNRRSPMTDIYVYPVPVQGREAPEAIVGAIEQANRLHLEGRIPLDVLIVGRGGGSLEDLWAFNDERVARAIAASELPVVAAVGHEVDFSIADFVADHRAATPSAAAELVSIDQMEWVQRFDTAAQILKTTLQRRIARERQQISHLAARLRHPGARLGQQRRDLDRLHHHLQRMMNSRLAGEKRQLGSLTQRLQSRHPGLAITSHQATVTQTRRRLQQIITARIAGERSSLEHLSRLLKSLSPTTTLERGYAIVEDSQGKILRNSQETTPGQTLSVRLSSGRLITQVTDVVPGNQ